MQKRLEYVDGKSAKFWQVAQRGSDLSVTFGRIGTSGQTQLRSFDSPAAARADADKHASAKLKKGYREVQASKPAKKTASKPTGKAATPTPTPTRQFPFLFIGGGLGTSYKCLECYAWFERAPSAKAQSLIKAALPLPVTTFARFKDDVLSFGSDDLLEIYVKAAYEPPHSSKPFKQAVRDVTAIAVAGNWSEKVLFPATKYWKAFCDHFERAMLDIHSIAPLKLALKPDDQDQDKAGPWHQWSVLESHRLVEPALKSTQKPPATLAYLTINVLESISDRLVKRMSPHARKVWLAWIDRMQTSGPRDVRDEYQDFASLLVDSFKKSEREDVLASLSKSMRASLAEQADD